MITRSGLAFLEDEDISGECTSDFSGSSKLLEAPHKDSTTGNLSFSAIRIFASIPPGDARPLHAATIAEPDEEADRKLVQLRDEKTESTEHKEVELTPSPGAMTRLRALRNKVYPSIQDVVRAKPPSRRTSKEIKKTQLKGKARIRAEGGPKKFGRSDLNDGWGLAAARRSDDPGMKALVKIHDEREQQKIRGNRRYKQCSRGGPMM